jgi:hypothetical protein
MAKTPEQIEADEADAVRGAGYKRKRRRKYGGRKRGTPNKRTIEKVRQAEREISAPERGKKIAVDHMDEMIEFLRGVVAKLVPWNADGTAIEGRDSVLWFKAVDAFQGFLNMRAPYQSPRLSAVQIVPSASRQRTVVNVTILNERGEKIFSDMPTESDLKQIEHHGEDEAA